MQLRWTQMLNALTPNAPRNAPNAHERLARMATLSKLLHRLAILPQSPQQLPVQCCQVTTLVWMKCDILVMTLACSHVSASAACPKPIHTR